MTAGLDIFKELDCDAPPQSQQDLHHISLHINWPIPNLVRVNRQLEMSSSRKELILFPHSQNTTMFRTLSQSCYKVDAFVSQNPPSQEKIEHEILKKIQMQVEINFYSSKFAKFYPKISVSKMTHQKQQDFMLCFEQYKFVSSTESSAIVRSHQKSLQCQENMR